MKTYSVKRLYRRKFIQTSSAALVGLSLSKHLNVSESSTTGPPISPRRIFPLNHNWRYSDTVTAGATGIEFDDSKFERVTIPHSNRILPWNSFDDKSYQFVSIYRQHFRLPNELKGQRVFIDFDGVMTACSVSINGERLGEHRGGYTPFSVELTSHLNWKRDNLPAAEVDSTERADIPPFGGNIDYLTFGGIYRDVALRVVADTFIENIFAKPDD